MHRHLRQHIRSMTGYTPGEQPQDGAYIKLNTNENPYPPSPAVFEAITRCLTADRLRKYPDPLGWEFRVAAGRVLEAPPEGILIGNGSDEVLTMLVRGFVPEGGLIAYAAPSYVLYATLAEIQGARPLAVPFGEDWSWDLDRVPADAHLTLLTNPNSPSGTMVPPRGLAGWSKGPLVVDEAYVDFAEETCLPLARTHERLLVTRTLSKAYSLAGIRFGFAVGSPEVVSHLYKIKDSYNCDVLSLAAASAAITDQEHMRANRNRILATRARMTGELRRLGFQAPDSQANFVWCRRTDRPVQPIYEELKRRKILVRYMNYDRLGDGLRITVGTDDEVDQLLDQLRKIVG